MQSRPRPPSGGTDAALSTMWRTRCPRLATTPGTTKPPDEWATSTTSVPSALASRVTEVTVSSSVTVRRSAGRRPRPGRSTASAGWASAAETRSQYLPVVLPPWIRTIDTAPVGATVESGEAGEGDESGEAGEGDESGDAESGAGGGGGCGGIGTSARRAGGRGNRGGGPAGWRHGRRVRRRVVRAPEGSRRGAGGEAGRRAGEAGEEPERPERSRGGAGEVRKWGRGNLSKLNSRSRNGGGDGVGWRDATAHHHHGRHPCRGEPRAVPRVPRSEFLEDFDAWRGRYKNPCKDLRNTDLRVRNWDDERA